MVSFKFEGGRELDAALKGLEKVTARNVATRALKKAAVPIRDKAKQLAPKDKGNLEAAIKIGTKANFGRGSFRSFGDWVNVFVGIDGSVLPPKDSKTKKNKRKTRFLQSGGGVAAYAIFIEMGTDSMKAQPYMRPAFDTEKENALALIKPELWNEIAAQAARAGRKAARRAAR